MICQDTPNMSLISFQFLAVGEVGLYPQNVLSHVAEVHRHVNGNVIILAQLMEETLVREMKMRLGHVTQKFAQVMPDAL